jgi:hypothetical protein
MALISTQVEANYNFAVHTDSHPWAREDPKGAQEEIDTLIKKIDGVVNLEAFDPKDIKGLASWVEAHTDGGGNTLILTGITPTSIYPAGNAKPDGSILEEFLDAGNTIFNTGEYTFYTSEGPDETNGQAALPNIIDVPEAFVWMGRGPDAWQANPVEMTPTQAGKDHIPSLKKYNTSYPFHVEDYEKSPWEVEIALAENKDDDLRIDPAVLFNEETGGRLGIFVQVYVGDVPHPGVSWGEIMGEFITNYYIPEVLSVEPINKLTTIWGRLKSSH